MLLHRRTSKPAPPPVPGIEGKDCVKFLGITFHKYLCNWDVHIDSFLSGAVSRPFILRVCKYYGYTKDQLGALFQSLIIGFFQNGSEVWASACQSDLKFCFGTFIRRAYRFSCTNRTFFMSDVM